MTDGGIRYGTLADMYERQEALRAAAQGGVTTQAWNCNWSYRYAFYSQANSKFVSAEFGYGGSLYGMLRARPTNVGPWELFYLQ
ncbi:hypothetical protein [Nonomuraea sp. NPDC048916]|uniref:hypothetical protein n=1 Tax=Nonomuraea sp. NPDC048916 TaxID=3154232 RepID=UPI0033E0240F